MLQCSNISAIKLNLLEHNLEYGILVMSVNATIWNNNFINNNYNNITEIHSQAKVDANYTSFIGLTKWYNEETQEGNYWSELEWIIGVEYSIDSGSYTDIYPLENPVVLKIFD
ncbi:MAG: hypothetical protein ACFFDW_00675 [Candidatus Thorarchaeota archaeon]